MPALPLRYNIAPTQRVAAVRQQAETDRELVQLRWGLIPSWAKDAAIGSSLINARSETAAKKPSFRSAMRKRRCLIPADGFYEWRRVGGEKQPYLIGLLDDAVFAFAGLWEAWDKGGERVESCTILTTSANELLKPLHDRMPVIVAPADYAQWLDPAIVDPAEVQPLLRAYPPDQMRYYPVDSRVNSPRNDDPQCAEETP